MHFLATFNLFVCNLKGCVWEKWELNSSDHDGFANSEYGSNFIDALQLRHQIPELVHITFIAFYVFIAIANVCLRITIIIQDEQQARSTRESRAR